MMTPAHIAASLFVWRDQPGWRRMSAIVFGAALPDLAMVGFYVFQKAIGTPEQVIWSERYFAEHWQLLFDLCNSIPIALVAMIIFARLDRPILWLISASALLHMLCDLPVHHHDAHRHFLPLTDWRFRSSVSYWNPEFPRSHVCTGGTHACCHRKHLRCLPRTAATDANRRRNQRRAVLSRLMLMAIIWLQMR